MCDARALGVHAGVKRVLNPLRGRPAVRVAFPRVQVSVFPCCLKLSAAVTFVSRKGVTLATYSPDLGVHVSVGVPPVRGTATMRRRANVCDASLTGRWPW